MRIFTLMLLALCLANTASAAPAKNVTLYLDGALVEIELPVRKGSADVHLPAGYAAGSLRVKPVGGAVIRDVTVDPVKPDPRAEREIADLSERKAQLQDRLKALEVREGVFVAAAKSQSSKAPRKTKSNPEPLAAVRQGTDYALSQLAGVYTLQRKARSEMKQVEERLAVATKRGGFAGAVARIRLLGAAGAVRLSWLDTGLSWQPQYEIRVDSVKSSAELFLTGRYPALDSGSAASVVPAAWREAEKKLPLLLAGPDRIIKAGTWRLELDNLRHAAGVMPSLAFTFKAPADTTLPAGDAACYLDGEYLGKARYEASAPGELKTVRLGE